MATLTSDASICGNFSEDEIKLIGTDTQAIMHVLTIDDPAELVLLQTHSRTLAASEINGETFHVLCDRMLATVHDPAHPGVGIAAPQVGILKRVIAVQRFDMQDEPFRIYVNPCIVEYCPDCEVAGEGCLSVPNLSGGVSRSKSIVIDYLDPVSKTQVQETVEGFTAVIFQHEIDHLDGILFTQKIEELPFEPDDVDAESKKDTK